MPDQEDVMPTFSWNQFYEAISAMYKVHEMLSEAHKLSDYIKNAKNVSRSCEMDCDMKKKYSHLSNQHKPEIVTNETLESLSLKLEYKKALSVLLNPDYNGIDVVKDLLNEVRDNISEVRRLPTS